jgi:predicted cobalt transporter CbtA
MTLGFLLRRGLAAGAAAGVVAAGVVWLVVEPVLRRALALEEPAMAHGGHHDEPLVSRGAQVVGGLLTTAVVGVLVGVVFAVVFARVRHRLSGGTDFGRSVLLAVLGFGVFSLLPAVKYPANPPGVGNSATVTERTLLYALSILMGLLVLTVVTMVHRALGGRRLRPAQVVGIDAVVAAAGIVAVLALLPPTPDAIPADVPADLLWDFRLASLAQLASMWATLGLVFGLLLDARAEQAAVPEPGSTALHASPGVR